MSGSKQTYDGKMDEHVMAIYRYYLKDTEDRNSSDYTHMCIAYYLLTTELEPIKIVYPKSILEDCVDVIKKVKCLIKLKPKDKQNV